MRYVILTLIVAVFSLTSCQTVQGLGSDIKKAGEGLERVAR